MSTWRDDITDPVERAAYELIGSQDDVCLTNMIRALEGPLRWMNTPADTQRLAAAKYIRTCRARRTRHLASMRRATRS